MDGHTREAGLEICKQLGIDPARVLGINIFVLTRTLVVKTLDGDMNCSLVEDRNAVGDLVFLKLGNRNLYFFKYELEEFKNARA